MDYHNKPRIFVIGFMGSERKGTAEKIAKELNYRLVDLDREIEQEDGRSIQRICMTMGEHEYRNKEYESLEKLAGQNRIVVACGDGTILDEMSREILKKKLRHHRGPRNTSGDSLGKGARGAGILSLCFYAPKR